MKAFYLELRQKAAATDGAPITARQLESLVRLAEARARADLREVATESDALDVVDLMRRTILDEFTDESGIVDYKRAGGKSKQVHGLLRNFPFAVITNRLLIKTLLAAVDPDLQLRITQQRLTKCPIVG